MPIDPLVFAGLLAVDDQLALVDTNRKTTLRKSGDSQGDPQLLLFGFLNIVVRIGIGGGFLHSIEGPLEMIESEEQRRIEQG